MKLLLLLVLLQHTCLVFSKRDAEEARKFHLHFHKMGNNNDSTLENHEEEEPQVEESAVVGLNISKPIPTVIHDRCDFPYAVAGNYCGRYPRPMYSFDKKYFRCGRFYWNGCDGGSPNRFVTKRACERECGVGSGCAFDGKLYAVDSEIPSMVDIHGYPCYCSETLDGNAAIICWNSPPPLNYRTACIVNGELYELGVDVPNPYRNELKCLCGFLMEWGWSALICTNPPAKFP